MSKHGGRAALERERRRRSTADRAPASSVPAANSRRDAAQACGWCGGPVTVKATGRIPKWCSATCRQRAWEQSRAAASGRSAVEVLERVVEVPVERVRPPRRDEWPAALRELTAQLDDGRIYTRDVSDIATALTDLIAAVTRRQNSRRPRR